MAGSPTWTITDKNRKYIQKKRKTKKIWYNYYVCSINQSTKPQSCTSGVGYIVSAFLYLLIIVQKLEFLDSSYTWALNDPRKDWPDNPIYGPKTESIKKETYRRS